MREFLGLVNPARWQYTPGGTIWRVSPSHPEVLLGEERNLDGKRTRFFCLEKKSGRIRWQKQSYGEEWWIGIEAMNRDTLFLHKFAQPDMPEHQSIIAVDIQSGGELWRNNELTLHQVFEKTILARRPSLHGTEEIELDTRTGATIQPPGTVPRALPDAFDDDVHYPVPVVNVADEFPEFVRVWEALPPDRFQGAPLEAVQYKRCIVVAYHIRITSQEVIPPRYRQEILVSTSSGRITFRGAIVDDTTTIVPESFFVQQGALYFVTLRHTLMCVWLPDHE